VLDGPAGWGQALYSRVLDALGEPDVLLDVGCGEGALLRAAADRGLAVAGVEPDPARLARAARLVPGARLHRGSLDRLPVPDGSAAAVSCVQVLMHLSDPVAAVRELRRVVAPGGLMAATVWGPRERCALGVLGAALAPLLAPLAGRPSERPDPRAAGPLSAFSGAGLLPLDRAAGGAPRPGRSPGRSGSRGSGIGDDGRLARLVGSAGLTVTVSEDVVCPFELPDQRALLTVVHASELGRRARTAAGSKRVRQALLAAVEPYRRADGGYTLENTFRLVVGRAPHG
jgi:SAM-dependent methyltransferase